MVEKTVTIYECNIPNCATPQDGVQRIEITLGKKQYLLDLCARDRVDRLEELLKVAHKVNTKRYGVKVTNPEDIPRRR